MLYSLLPPKAVENNKLITSSSDISSSNVNKSDFFDSNSDDTSSDTNNDDKTVHLLGNREGMLKILSEVFINNEKWQRQETCLIISHDIIQKALSVSLDDMNKKEWSEITLSSGLSFLLYDLRSYLYSASLHPMYEIRRMISQILPIIARATVIFQPETLLIEADFTPRSIDDNCDSLGKNKVGSKADIVVEYYDGIDIGCDEADSKAVVLCAWLAAVCKASQHIIELDMTGTVVLSNDKQFQQALEIYGIRTSIDEYPSEFDSSGFVWAMEISGRLSEENSKKDFSNGLKKVLIGGNQAAYSSLARSLSYVKKLLIIAVDLFWSRDGDSSNISANTDTGDPGDAHMKTTADDIKVKNLRKVLPRECVSCDYIDAAVLSAAVLQRIDPDPLNSHLIRKMNEIDKHKIENKVGNENINRAEGPLFLVLTNVITKVAREIADQQSSYSSGKMMSPGSSSTGIVTIF